MKNVTVPTLFNQHGVKTISVDGYRFSVSVRLSASIPDKELGFQWLRDNNLGDIIKPTVNAMTLASTAKELIEEGLELDPDLFKVSYNENTSVTRVKGT